MIFLEEIKNEIQQKQKQNQSPKNVSGGADTLLVREAILTRARGTFTSGYHLEFIYTNEDEARAFCEILAQHEIFPKMMAPHDDGEHDPTYRIYIKNSDCICNLLALAGASTSLLKLHDQIALRDVRNTSNRRANCDTANIEKQIATARRQIEIIQGLDDIPPELQSTARARIANPEASYEELASILKISKSGVARDLRKLTESRPS